MDKRELDFGLLDFGAMLAGFQHGMDRAVRLLNAGDWEQAHDVLTSLQGRVEGAKWICVMRLSEQVRDKLKEAA